MTAAAALLRRALPPGRREDEPAWAWLREHGMPTNDDETWRYTALDQLLTGEYPPQPPGSHRSHLDLRARVGDHGGPRLVLVNGAYDSALSDVAALPAGVGVGWGPGVDDPLERRYDGFRALNRLAGSARAEVRVAPGVQVELPVHIVHVIDAGTASITHPRTGVRVGRDAQVTVIESYAGSSWPTLTNAVTTVDVGEDAHLRHHKVLLGGSEGAHVAHTAVTLERGGQVDHLSVLTGSAVARNAVDVLLADGAVAHLGGLDLAIGAQRHDTEVIVEHAASHGTSRQLFKAAVDGHARSSFGGRVIVGRGAVGNDADQSSRSLLLAPSAQADTRPWLEIFADDVRCTHGSSIGRLSDEALFYLRTRGISRDQAKAMLVDGFIAEMVESIEVPSLRDLVRASVRTAMGRPV